MRVCWKVKIMKKDLGEEELEVEQGEEVEQEVEEVERGEEVDRGEEVEREVKEEAKNVLVEEGVDKEVMEEGAVEDG